MYECFKCGISDDNENVKFFDVINRDGIVKICANCHSNENFPILKKPIEIESKNNQEPQTVYKRLSKMVGINPLQHNIKPVVNEQDVKLRDLVEKTYSKRAGSFNSETHRDDLIENFHWIIMRQRRMKKLTQEQLAKEIGESTAAIVAAEKGLLPEGDYNLIKKIENILDINLIKESTRKQINRKTKEELKLDIVAVKELTISDLRNIQNKKEILIDDFSDEDEGKELYRELRKDINLEREFIEEVMRKAKNLPDNEFRIVNKENESSTNKIKKPKRAIVTRDLTKEEIDKILFKN